MLKYPRYIVVIFFYLTITLDSVKMQLQVGISNVKSDFSLNIISTS